MERKQRRVELERKMDEFCMHSSAWILIGDEWESHFIADLKLELAEFSVAWESEFAELGGESESDYMGWLGLKWLKLKQKVEGFLDTHPNTNI